jgi:hypothetical protein
MLSHSHLSRAAKPRNFAPTKLRGLSPSAARSAMHVIIINRLPGGSSE